MKLLNITLLLLAMTTGLLAQERSSEERPDKERRAEKLEARKVAYITTELDLSPLESQQFWPLYNEYQKKHKANKAQLKEQSNDVDLENLSEAEAQKLLETLLATDKLEYELKRDYTEQLSQVIPVHKLVKLHVLERKFRDDVVRSIKKKMKRREKRRPRGE